MKIEAYWLVTEIDNKEIRLAAIARSRPPNKEIIDYVINNVDAAKLDADIFNDGPCDIIIDDVLYWAYENMLGGKNSMEIR